MKSLPYTQNTPFLDRLLLDIYSNHLLEFFKALTLLEAIHKYRDSFVVNLIPSKAMERNIVLSQCPLGNTKQ